ncbi:WD40-repeat-containing domain protein [Lipomyces starkeyi]
MVEFHEILAEWTYGIESDFALNGTSATWRSGQPIAWGDEARKIEIDDYAYDCCVSADEKFLALAIGRQVHIYDLENLELRDVLIGHTEKIGHVEFLPLDITCNKYKLFSSSNSNRNLDDMIIVWTLDKQGKNTNKPADSVDIEDNLVLSGELTGFGSRAVIDDGKLLVYLSDNPLRRQIKLVLEGHTDKVMWANVSPDGKIVASVSWDQTVKWTRICEIEVSTHWLRSLSWSHDGHHLAAGGLCGVVYVWNPLSGEQKQKWQLKGGERHGGTFLETRSVQWLDSKGLMLAYKGTEGGVNWRSDPKKSDLIKLTKIVSGLGALHYLRNANQLISVDTDQTVRFWVIN